PATPGGPAGPVGGGAGAVPAPPEPSWVSRFLAMLSSSPRSHVPLPWLLAEHLDLSHHDLPVLDQVHLDRSRPAQTRPADDPVRGRRDRVPALLGVPVTAVGAVQVHEPVL